MKPEVFQCVREIGNSLVFMQLLDSASRLVRSPLPTKQDVHIFGVFLRIFRHSLRQHECEKCALVRAVCRQHESMAYMQYAPFIGTPSVSKDAPRGGTPLYRSVCAMVDKLNQVSSGKDR